MSLKRLSGEDRDNIVTELLNRAFTERRKAVIAARNAIADAVYNDLYPPAVLKKMTGLPAGWLPEDDDVMAKISGQVTRLYFYDKHGKPAKRIMAAGHVSGVVAIYDGASPVAELNEEHLRLQKELSDEEAAAKAEAQAIVHRVNTVPQLLEQWPDVKPILEKVFGSLDEPQLPVVAVEALNARFKLPAKKSRSKA